MSGTCCELQPVEVGKEDKEMGTRVAGDEDGKYVGECGGWREEVG